MYRNTAANRLDDLPKVRMRENAEKQLLLYNLSTHSVDNVGDAIGLLMLGDDNRVVAETPKNDASTRSHCIFMIFIEGLTDTINDNGEISSTRTLAKLHIVDLSGSEKATKTDMSGIRFDEAKNINLSLHFLGQVISSINKKTLHVPYRNTMMTMILRDSLGGNCKTRMIATVSSLLEDIQESISTCRFAQSVSLVKNLVVKNEIEDPEVVIKKQRSEIEDLKDEIKLLKGIDQKEFLEEEDIQHCKVLVDNYLKSDTFNDEIKLKDFLLIRECFAQLKLKYKQLEAKFNEGGALSKSINLNSSSSGTVCLNCNAKEKDFLSQLEKMKGEITKAKQLLKKKDEEMKTLLNYYEKQNTQRSNFQNLNNTLLEKISKEEDSESKLSTLRNNYLGEEIKFTGSSQDQVGQSFVSSNNNLKMKEETIKSLPMAFLAEVAKVNSMLKADAVKNQPLELTKEIVQDARLAYEYFKKNYIKANLLESNLAKLQELYLEGQHLAQQNEKTRQKMNFIKKRIEVLKKEYKAMNYDDVNRAPIELRNMEDSIYAEMSKEKENHEVEYNLLKKTKSEIQFLQHLVEENSTKLGKDFYQWHFVILKKFELESNTKLNIVNDFNLSRTTNPNTNQSVNVNQTSVVANTTLSTSTLNQKQLGASQISSSSRTESDVMSLMAQAKGIINKNVK